MARGETPGDKRAKVKTSGLAKASGFAHVDPRHGSGVRQGGRGTGKPPSSRELRASARRAAIVAAGLDEFTARGFAATRLDDVARRAGVAKGTIYLHFKDKEALFHELVRTALGPLVLRVSNPPIGEGAASARALMESLADMFVREVIGTKRGDILRLIISEGGRFPVLSDVYYNEVIAHGIVGMRKLIDYGVSRGEIRDPRVAEFPQLMAAPLVVAVVWQGLFAKHQPLDFAEMLRVHLDLIFNKGKAA